MPELTLESLAARVAELERELSALKTKSPTVVAPTRDWLSVVGISDDNEFTRSMLAEMEAASEAERQAALRGDDE